MPRRNDRLRLTDMLEAIGRIEQYTVGLSFEAFSADQRTIDAVIRNFEILGESARRLPADLTARQPAILWRDIGDMRNLLMHQYFGVDLATVWKTIQDDLAPLRAALEALLIDFDENSQ